MKRKAFIFALTALLTMVGAQSCLFEQEDIFDKTSSARLIEAMDDARNALVSSEYGWVMEYYPESTQKYGGYVLTMKFTQMEVEIRSQESTPQTAVTSYYKMNSENGPCIIFDTYNTFIHTYSNPSATDYQAKGGEFEFVVMKVEEGRITLRGTRTGNILYMYKLDEPAEDYLTKVAETEKTFMLVGLKGNVGPEAVTFTIDTDGNQISYTDGEGAMTTQAYVLTPNGFRTYAPFKFGDITLQNFVLNEDGKHVDASGVQFEAAFPKGYRPYSEYAGKYLFTWGKDSEYSATVTLEPDEDGSGFNMTGLNPNYDIYLSYSKGKGTLLMASQMLKLNGDYVMIGTKNVGLTSNDRSKGYIKYETNVGMVTIWNEDEANPVYTFSDNAVWGTYQVNSFFFYMFTGTIQSTAARGTNLKEYKDFWPGGANYVLEYVKSLTKIAD